MIVASRRRRHERLFIIYITNYIFRTIIREREREEVQKVTEMKIVQHPDNGTPRRHRRRRHRHRHHRRRRHQHHFPHRLLALIYLQEQNFNLDLAEIY